MAPTIFETGGETSPPAKYGAGAESLTLIKEEAAFFEFCKMLYIFLLDP
jgi:hypothetical protein